MNNKILTQVKFDEKGLVPVVAQSAKTKEVIMLGYMNADALSKTLETGMMHYYSRSRKKLWMKGEQSGNFQEVKEMYIDCDNDTLLFIVEQKRGGCHTGYYSCFFRKLNNKKNDFMITGKKVFNPDEVYKK
ncbi:MAG: phosphoribosyl-AMP cyclohydrolase [Candidatus Omnitrophica bacterium]|nr:phosphoribosyl-AMP cyclohydrolase [Candidatus Omnitrophota bacterium]